MKKIISLICILIMLVTTRAEAHGGNVTGWKDKNSDKIVKHNGVYYGYHKQDGVRHYHQVEWNEAEQKWEILKTAVYYDENFNIINNYQDTETKKVEVKYSDSVDGDTAKFELNGEIITVRFLGIDTPESVHPTKEVEAYGVEASNFTKEKLKNANKIEIEYDANADKKDKYERHLAWIFVDDVLLQDEIIKNGFAQTYMLQDNYKYAGTLQESEVNAKKEKKGIWSGETTSNEQIGSVEEGTLSAQETIQEENETVTKPISQEVGFVFVIASIIIAILKGTKKSNKKRKK